MSRWLSYSFGYQGEDFDTDYFKYKIREWSYMISASPGVYVLYLENIGLVYIGSSKNLFLRIKQHWQWLFSHKVPFMWKISYSRKYGDWMMREARLLKRIKPKFNQRDHTGRLAYHRSRITL